MTTRRRAVLFDAAGTLLLARKPVGETYRAFALDFGVDLPATRIEEAFLRIVAQAAPMLFPDESAERRRYLERRWWRDQVRATFRAADASVRFGNFEAYFEQLWHHYAGRAAWTLAPGAREALAALRARHVPMAIVSNFDHRLLNILQELDIIAYFNNVTIPAEVAAAKPDPRIFLRALERLGEPPRGAFYVGDRAVEDVAGASAAGLRPIAVTSLATLAELPATVDALEQELQ